MLRLSLRDKLRNEVTHQSIFMYTDAVSIGNNERLHRNHTHQLADC